MEGISQLLDTVLSSPIPFLVIAFVIYSIVKARRGNAAGAQRREAVQRRRAETQRRRAELQRQVRERAEEGDDTIDNIVQLLTERIGAADSSSEMLAQPSAPVDSPGATPSAWRRRTEPRRETVPTKLLADLPAATMASGPSLAASGSTGFGYGTADPIVYEAMPSAWGSQVREIVASKKASESTGSEEPTPAASSPIEQLLGDGDELRRAFILSELLQRPRPLRR